MPPAARSGTRYKRVGRDLIAERVAYDAGKGPKPEASPVFDSSGQYVDPDGAKRWEGTTPDGIKAEWAHWTHHSAPKIEGTLAFPEHPDWNVVAVFHLVDGAFVVTELRFAAVRLTPGGPPSDLIRGATMSELRALLTEHLEYVPPRSRAFAPPGPGDKVPLTKPGEPVGRAPRERAATVANLTWGTQSRVAKARARGPRPGRPRDPAETEREWAVVASVVLEYVDAGSTRPNVDAANDRRLRGYTDRQIRDVLAQCSTHGLRTKPGSGKVGAWTLTELGRQRLAEAEQAAQSRKPRSKR